MQLNTQFFNLILFVDNDFEKMQSVGSLAVVPELCMGCACSSCHHLHSRVKEDNNTKEGFEHKASSLFTETLPDIQPLLLESTTKPPQSPWSPSRMHPAAACVMYACRKLKVTANT